MAATRREFVKGTVAVGASLALKRSASAQATHPVSGASANLGPFFEYTRGLGMYPGAPSENFSPTLVTDTSGTYRNLALLRPAFHSSAYDYNLTAQLVTDGIVHTRTPDWISVVVDGQVLPKNERESPVDHDPPNVLDLTGAHPQVEIHLGGGESLPFIDRLQLFVVVADHIPLSSLQFTAWTSEDGHAWEQAGTAGAGTPSAPDDFPPDLAHNAHILQPSIPFSQPRRARQFRVELRKTGTAESSDNTLWRLGQVAFYNGPQRVQIGGPYSFTSAWKSAGLDREWVYVDLGVRCTFDRVTLHWIAPAAEGRLEVSDDAETWHDLQPLPAVAPIQDLHLASPAKGRYVRVLMTRPASADGYILSELEVYGRGGLRVEPHPVTHQVEPRTTNLAGHGWQLQRADLLQGTGEAISRSGYDVKGWITATVPGTVLTSYLNIGAIPDPNFGANQLHISDSFFYEDFWYRREFLHEPAAPGERTWLDFDGVNWKAEVFLNGAHLGNIDGGFMRARFDVTAKLHADTPNVLAVRVIKNANPGSCKQKTFENPGKNGGALGVDGPTYAASVGWDWISTIRGRNDGIWGDVKLRHTGPITLENHLVISKLPLPDTSSAELTVTVDLVNHTDRPVSGVLDLRFGQLTAQQRVTIGAASGKKVTFNPASHPALRLNNPELWNPAGYGDPRLYDCALDFTVAGRSSDRKAFKAGIREITASEDGGALRLFINGRRFIVKGGNWGFPESMLRYRAREYDVAVRYHRDMHFNTIRNWVGQIGDDAFYEACDRHGILVWQDFWLANPWDGPIPADNALFLANARDTVLRIRHHASIGLYCGRNEGFPPAPLEAGLRQLLAELHPDLHYIPSSADATVSGHGPYRALPPETYFRIADTKLHSEIGAPAVPPIESVRAMMPAASVWPQALDWGIHDFCLAGAQGGVSFRELIENSYGGASSAEEWLKLAQFINFDTYRAMFESQSQHRMGLLLWMSHPCWPSFVWQTYDFYFEPTSAYFGSKLGAEPIHIQWNPVTETVEVVNYSAGNLSGLTATAEILNLDGTSQWKKAAPLDAREDTVAAPISMRYPAQLSDVHFLRLALTQGSKSLSTNFYLRGREQGNFRAIRELAKATLTTQTLIAQMGTALQLTATITNTSAIPALMLRLKAVRERTGDRILPALYSENYFHLMPGETRQITIDLHPADTRGEPPKLLLEGFNADPAS